MKLSLKVFRQKIELIGEEYLLSPDQKIQKVLALLDLQEKELRKKRSNYKTMMSLTEERFKKAYRARLDEIEEFLG